MTYTTTVHLTALAIADALRADHHTHHTAGRLTPHARHPYSPGDWCHIDDDAWPHALRLLDH